MRTSPTTLPGLPRPWRGSRWNGLMSWPGAMEAGSLSTSRPGSRAGRSLILLSTTMMGFQGLDMKSLL